MKFRIIIILIFLSGVFVLSPSCQNKKTEYFELSKSEYLDRIKAMWIAQMVAVHMGWDFEHKPSAVKNVHGYSAHRLRKIKENGGAQVDDDWYYEMTTLNGFERYGIGMTTDQLGDQWIEDSIGTWGSAFYTRQALLRGIPGSKAGLPENNRMWFTVGNQNRSDLFAMLTPCMPNLTGTIARKLGHINSYAEGTDGGVLIGALESMAFYEHDVHELLKKCVAILAPSAPHRQCYEQVIRMGESGKTWQEAAKAVEERWGIEYPATNSAVWNSGLAAVALWYGNGSFWKSVNIAFQASDYSDADCVAANVATILAAMYGMQIIPDELVKPFHNRMRGDHLGFMKLKEPVDMSLDSLAKRTFQVGLKMLTANGAIIRDSIIKIPMQRTIETQPEEYFHPDQFTQWWNPNWKIERAGFGAPGGGVRGVRGGTFVDGNILSTYPRDEIRGVKIYRTVEVGDNQKLSFEVSADPGRIWKLLVYVDNQKILSRLVDGGPALDWPGIAPGEYPQPLLEYQKCAQVRKWYPVSFDLSDYAGQRVVIRLYQNILVRNGFPGNAYWRNLEVQ